MLSVVRVKASQAEVSSIDETYHSHSKKGEKWKLFQSGYVGSVQITQGFVLLGAILLETSIAMVLLSLILKYGINRWANIIVGIIQIAAVVQSLTGPLYWNLYYAFFAAIEIACLLFIVWYAWTWRQPEGAVRTPGQTSL